MEGTAADVDTSPNTEGPSTPTTATASAAMHEGPGEQTGTSTPATTPCRMKLRSQDSTRAEQASLKNLKADALKKDGL